MGLTDVERRGYAEMERAKQVRREDNMRRFGNPDGPYLREGDVQRHNEKCAQATYGGIAGGRTQVEANAEQLQAIYKRAGVTPKVPFMSEVEEAGMGAYTMNLKAEHPMPGSAAWYKPSMAEEQEKMSGYHSDIATKAAQAAQASLFFRRHPEFEEFIRLIRSGAIQL